MIIWRRREENHTERDKKTAIASWKETQRKPCQHSLIFHNNESAVSCKNTKQAKRSERNDSNVQWRGILQLIFKNVPKFATGKTERPGNTPEWISSGRFWRGKRQSGKLNIFSILTEQSARTAIKIKLEEQTQQINWILKPNIPGKSNISQKSSTTKTTKSFFTRDKTNVEQTTRKWQRLTWCRSAIRKRSVFLRPMGNSRSSSKEGNKRFRRPLHEKEFLSCIETAVFLKKDMS